MTSLEYFLVNDLPPGEKELKKVKLQWRTCRYLQEIIGYPWITSGLIVDNFSVSVG